MCVAEEPAQAADGGRRAPAPCRRAPHDWLAETHSLLLAIVMICVVSSVIWLCMATVARIAPQASYCGGGQPGTGGIHRLAQPEWPGAGRLDPVAERHAGVTSFVLLHHGVQRMTRPRLLALDAGEPVDRGPGAGLLPGVAQTALALLASAGLRWPPPP